MIKSIVNKLPMNEYYIYFDHIGPTESSWLNLFSDLINQFKGVLSKTRPIEVHKLLDLRVGNPTSQQIAWLK